MNISHLKKLWRINEDNQGKLPIKLFYFQELCHEKDLDVSLCIIDENIILLVEFMQTAKCP